MSKFSIVIGLLLFPVFASASVERLNCRPHLRQQKETNTCWLHSAVMMMEQSAGAALSVDALLISEIRSRALVRYLGHDTPWDGGAGPTRPFALALEHGLVPEAAWDRKGAVVESYGEIFAKIEGLLEQKIRSKEEFLSQVDKVIRHYTLDLPPKEFWWKDRYWTAVDWARSIIGSGRSVGYDFRNVKYDDSRYGRMGDVPWTTIIGRDQDLVRIVDVIPKNVFRVSGAEAFDQLVRIFREGRPVAFTFIWSDQHGRPVSSLNEKREYYSVHPSAQGSYMSSHLVLVTGLITEGDRVVAFEVLDPLARSLERGYRIVTRQFFEEHGKTVHEIEAGCSHYLIQ